jgi:hypothetical protein
MRHGWRISAPWMVHQSATDGAQGPSSFLFFLFLYMNQ